MNRLKSILRKFPFIKEIAKKIFVFLGKIFSDKKSTVRYVTTIDENTFFGYFDRTPWNNDMSKILYLEYNSNILFHTCNSICEVKMFDFTKKHSETLYFTKTWNSQQGALIKWVSNSKFIFNTYEDSSYCSYVFDVDSKEKERMPIPVYDIFYEKKYYLSLNFGRINHFRKGYGYNNIDYNISNDDTLIQQCNMISKAVKSLVKVEDIIKIVDEYIDVNSMWVNHILINPDGNYFVFILRWYKNNIKYDMLMGYDMSVNSLKVLLNDGMISHYSWINKEELIIYATTRSEKDAYYIFNVQSLGYKKLSNMPKSDGHPTLSPNKKYIICDTYPNFFRKSRLLLYDIQHEKTFSLGKFYNPPKFNAEFRCDMHPRWSPDSKKICFDSVFDGKRKLAIFDLEEWFKNE